jgi:hypothetical protein
MTAPYQIALHDGRLIFAPQDVDQVIRRRATPPPDAPESPPIDQYLEDLEDEDEYFDEDGDDQNGDEMDLGTGDKHYQQDDDDA